MIVELEKRVVMSKNVFTGERFVPGIEDEKLSAEHYQRYFSVCEYVKGKKVLDAACGEGYGSDILANYAKTVIGMDIDEGAISRAKEHYGNKGNLHYIVGSIASLNQIDDHSIDVVVSFETIEHVDEFIQNQYLNEINRVLKLDGVLFMSTPNKKVYSDLYHYRNEFHVKEFYYDEYLTFLHRKFSNVKLYNQSFEIMSLLNDVTLSGGKINYYNSVVGKEVEGKYLVAIASNREIDGIDISSVYVSNMEEYDIITNRILTLQKEVEERNQHIKKLDNEIDKYIKNEKYEYLERIQYLDGQYKSVVKELEQIKNEKTYKFSLKLRKIFFFFLPPNSRRRFIVRVTYNAVKNPRLMFHVINPKRIAHFFKYLKLEGMEGVQRRYKDAVDLEKRSSCTNQLLELSKVKVKSKKLKDYDKLALIRQDAPLVSIIIPVYNEFYYTYECVKSIVKQSGNISYEIIIANDKSTDITRDIEKVFENIRLVTTKENVRFLLNCNNAAKFAKGKYILFLNNDTQVQKNWLAPLVNLMERDASIGMVGSKLVFPDGRLQEAGGIIWKDASAWNYGRGENPEQPEYNYVKEVDYISGAAIMIKSDLWNEIGGFDEIFAPAYCEDSDLAFEVRKRGYKVMYQPLSVVVHFEGVSNGTDTSVGLKSYQVENQQKLLTKWNEVLSEEHFPNAENVFCARDRSVNKPVVVMVDHYVPQYDKDAGSRTVFQYLSLFVKQGYNVKFIGDNFYRDEPYTTALQQMGIEVLYGSYYSENWKQWIKDNSNNIDFVFLNRPHISVKYIDFIRKETNAKIIYYGHDLHFLREYRNYELTKDAEILKLSEKWKTNEFELMRKADVVYYPSNVEIEEIKKIDSSLNAKAIVAYMFENVSDVDYLYEQRKDLMFIGGFGHAPNIDGVLWFSKEVFPIIKKEIPDIVFHILGSKPTDEIKALENDNIKVRGFVSDEELADYYAKCKISVVPLRYGAGIKGKVVEALKFGIPVVTTSTGAEGIVDADDILCVEDEPIKLAKRIIELYKNEDELKSMSTKSTNYIRTYFSEAKAWDVIKEDFK